MSVPIDTKSTHSSTQVSVRERLRSDPTFQGFWALRLGFTVLPIVFGLDKFTNVLTHWDKYLAPRINDMVPGTATQAMYAVGVIEVVAGLVVLLAPRFGGYLVALWLAGIIVNLVMIGGYWDVAFRDFGLLLAGLTLARLATAFPDGQLGRRG